MERITKGMLERKVDWLNELTDSPKTPYTRIDGKFTANPGNYHLGGAYGGWTLQRMSNTGGGVSTPLHCGYCPKRELAGLLDAFITGIRIEQDK